MKGASPVFFLVPAAVPVEGPNRKAAPASVAAIAAGSARPLSGRAPAVNLRGPSPGPLRRNP